MLGKLFKALGEGHGGRCKGEVNTGRQQVSQVQLTNFVDTIPAMTSQNFMP